MKAGINSRKAAVEIARTLLILLWVYAAVSKLLDYETSRSQMLNQVFPISMAEVLTWAVPAVELLTAGLLISPLTFRAGLLASLFLLIQFSIYISVVMTGIMGRVPCSCGGVLEQMTWGQHLLFNFFLIALTLVAIIFYLQTPRPKAFGKIRVPGSHPSQRDIMSSDIRQGNGENGVGKLPKIRAPDNSGRL